MFYCDNKLKTKWISDIINILHAVTEHILFHNSVDSIGYLLQAYRGSALRLPKGFKKLQVFKKNEIRQGHDNKPVKSAGSCVDLDQ